MGNEPLIGVKGLSVHFRTEDGLVRAVDGVDFTIGREKTLGVVGESGCGKSVTARAIMGLIEPPGQIAAGEILFHRDGQVLVRDPGRRAEFAGRVSQG
jgi:ABC-type dipeptide/oligopeptide/nickel transport system ATPase component